MLRIRSPIVLATRESFQILVRSNQASTMATSNPSISLHVQIKIDPKNVPAFFEAMKPVFDKVVAEPNLTFFEIYQSIEDPGTISWVENW